MEGVDGTGDDRTFRVNFSSEGVSKLRENVKEKLKEYMGEYTDDTLVEYVIVLLKNGRQKDEARNELNVFLDDDSDSFVAWLWDHLGSNLNLYVQPKQSHTDGVLKKNSVTREHTGRGSQWMESESTKLEEDKSHKSQLSTKLKGLQVDKGERPGLQSIVTDTINSNRESRRVSREKKSLSPELVRRKRDHPEERQQAKREGVSQATIAAPRRLLQFAVRDAVGSPKPSNLTSEPPLKRLRSVVSTSAEHVDLQERPHRNRPLARVPNGASAAMKAVAEATEDVRRSKSSSNVFNRLGNRLEFSENMNQLAELGDDAGEDGDFKMYNTDEQEKLSCDERDKYNDRYVSDRSALQRDTGMFIDPALVDYDLEVEARSRGVRNVAHSVTSGGTRIDILPVIQHRMVSNAKNLKTQDLRRELMANLDVDNQKLVGKSEAFSRHAGVVLMKENSNPGPVANSNDITEGDLLNESQKNQLHTPGLDPTGEYTEDADSRTLFVNNVHFAATKDTLSRHFSKFGAVLNIVILTDTATGQPKGSAYIEFISKEAAENALSFDGTSFMSRILRVVRKGSAQLETTSLTPWARVVRASAYSVPRYARPPFPMGATGVYRSRFPLKPGARNFQWKRETQSSTSETSITAPSNTVASVPRSLTYVRPEAKANGN